MLDQFRSLALFSLAELNYLRLEAMDLFERCLTEGSPDYLLDFVQQQIIQEPPRLDVLNDLAEDLHQRLLALREYHFDVRDRVLRTLRNDFDVNLALAAPSHTLDSYHLLDLDNVVDLMRYQNPALQPEEQRLLRGVIEASFEMAAQLHDDIAMTEILFDYVLDWVNGLSAKAAQQVWLNDWEETPATPIH